MRKSRKEGGRRLSWQIAYLLSLMLNSTLGFLGQFAVFYPYFVARDWLAKLGVVSYGIPFRDGYAPALILGLALIAVFAAIMAAVNFVVLRYASVSRRLYWYSAFLVALASSVVQLYWHMGIVY